VLDVLRGGDQRCIGDVGRRHPGHPSLSIADERFDRRGFVSGLSQSEFVEEKIESFDVDPTALQVPRERILEVWRRRSRRECR
jgi:hypothetical protein